MLEHPPPLRVAVRKHRLSPRGASSSPAPAAGSGCSRSADLLRAEEPTPVAATRWRRRSRTSPAKAKSRHLAVHERRAEPGRYLGLQARTGEARRPGTEGLRQEHRLLHRPGRAADEVAVQVRPSTASAGSGSSELFPHMAKHVDKMAFIHSLLDRLEQPLAGAVQDQHRHDPDGLPVRRRRGSPTASAARARTCRRSASCTTRSAAASRRGTR